MQMISAADDDVLHMEYRFVKWISVFTYVVGVGV
jgi:hypothetical protein